MKNKYVTPEISVAQLEKKDILSSSNMDNHTLNTKTRQMDLATFIADFVFSD
ncbi:MAG: hypothetical protein IIU39_03000 [Ruminococcus sp.]|nr:hypothetical protein [Ruminococcus sp.]